MEQEVQVETVETQNTQEQVEQPQTKVKSSDVLRELSKTFGVNLFDENGLTMLKEKLDAEKLEYTQLKDTSKTLTEKEQLFAQKEQEYQVKIEALGLGFQLDNLDEVLALAKVNVKEGQTLIDGLKSVKQKYGSVFATTDIGTQHNDLKGDKPDPLKNEQDKYLQESKYVQMWNKANKK